MLIGSEDYIVSLGDVKTFFPRRTRQSGPQNSSIVSQRHDNFGKTSEARTKLIRFASQVAHRRLCRPENMLDLFLILLDIQGSARDTRINRCFCDGWRDVTFVRQPTDLALLALAARLCEKDDE